MAMPDVCRQPPTRFSADVLEALRATDPGWQARVDDALQER